MANINKRNNVVFVDGVDFSGQLSNFRLTSAETDSDFVTFADAAAGGARDYTAEGTCAQDAAVGSFWNLMWASAGTTVTVLYKPYGNSVATAAQPHYSMSAVVSEPDGDFLGGDADASTTAVQTTEFAWSLTGKPTKVTS